MDLGVKGGYGDFGAVPQVAGMAEHVDMDFGGQRGFVTNSAAGVVQNPDTALLMSELRKEFEIMGETPEMKHSRRLLTMEMERISSNGEGEYLEVDIPKTIKLVKKILVPVQRYPQFNFVGKLLGPGGKTLQGMAKEFKCHIYILGTGSTRDRAKEEELLTSGDPQYAHYGLPLHVRVETIAAPHVAYQRVTGVLEILADYLQPVRDEIVAAQMAEMGHEFNPNGPPRGRGRGGRGIQRGGGGGRIANARGGRGGGFGQESFSSDQSYGGFGDQTQGGGFNNNSFGSYGGRGGGRGVRGGGFGGGRGVAGGPMRGRGRGMGMQQRHTPY